MSSFVNTVDLIGDEALTNSIIERSMTEIKDSHALNIGAYAFAYCSNLTTVDFSAVTTIGGYAFAECPNLTTVNFPALTTINDSMAFTKCPNLTTVNFPALMKIGEYTFYACSNLTALILRSETMASLLGTHVFDSTPIRSGAGYIYVPSDLISSYKAAKNWRTYANQFRALEDYTVDGTITGELDSTKI